jgi:hypothetical protein
MCAPFAGFVDLVEPDGDRFRGRATFLGREFGRFLDDEGYRRSTMLIVRSGAAHSGLRPGRDRPNRRELRQQAADMSNEATGEWQLVRARCSGAGWTSTMMPSLPAAAEEAEKRRAAGVSLLEADERRRAESPYGAASSLAHHAGPATSIEVARRRGRGRRLSFVAPSLA